MRAGVLGARTCPTQHTDCRPVPLASDSRFYRGAQAEVDLVLAYQRRDVVLLVPFAEGCAASLPRTIDAEAWEVLSGTI